jgi:hypothetical protein
VVQLNVLTQARCDDGLDSTNGVLNNQRARSSAVDLGPRYAAVRSR